MTSGDDQSALRPLRNVAATTAALRSGSVADDEISAAVIRVAAAVEMSLRRLLRDHPHAALQVRLRALAPDELRADEVLAELRQHDRISIELAAAVHELLEARQRLRAGDPPAYDDAALAFGVADRLEHEANASVPTPVPQPIHPAPVDGEETQPESRSSPFRRDRPRPNPGGRLVASAAVALAVIVLLVAWWLWPRGPDEMQEGIARFQDGAYEDAAAHFWRHAQAHPRDATARVYLARIHRRLDRPEMAQAQLDSALSIAPDDPDVLVELGFLLTDGGEHEAAVERFREALGRDPDSEAAWVGLVQSLRRGGRAEAADRVLERAPPALRSRLTLPDTSAVTP